MRKLSYLYEIPLFYALLFGTSFYISPDSPGYFDTNPSPYWLGVILFSYRYGISAGLISGLISAGLYLYSNWHYAEKYLFEDFTFYLLPSFFILFGVMLGIGVQRYQSIIKTKNKEYGILEKEALEVDEENKALQSINRELEKKIVTRMSTLITLYEGARRFELVKQEDLLKAILDFTVKTLRADQIGIYLKKNDQWELTLFTPEDQFSSFPQILKTNEGIIGQAGTANKVMSLRDFLKQEDAQSAHNLQNQCLVAGPLRIGETGPAMGVLAIYKMPFLEFNSSAVNLLTFILQWGSRSLGRSKYIEILKENEVIDPEFNVYSEKYFYSRAQQELYRSKTYYLPLSVLLFKFKGLSKLDSLKKSNFLLSMSVLIKECIRDMDILASFNDAEIPFAALLITLSSKQSNEVVKNIQDAYEKLLKTSKYSIELQIGVSHFNPRTQDISQMISEAKETINHGKI